MKRGLIILGVAALLTGSMSGCGINAMVTDLGNLATYVEGIKLQKEENLKVLDGGAIRSVKLDAIENLTLYCNETRIVDRQLYYLVEIGLLDGSRIAPSAQPGGVNSRTFLCVDDVMTGKNKSGKYSIELNAVRRIERRK